MGKVSKRLNRMLLLVPYISNNEGVSIEALSKKFGVSRKEILGDLDTLMMCGIPEYTPGDLIEYYIEGGRVYIRQADYFSRPLRMTREEATVLLIAGRALQRAGIISSRGPLTSALRKVEKMLSTSEQSEVEDVAGRIWVEMKSYGKKWRRIIEKGLINRNNLLIDYYSYSTDEVKRREVEPLSLIFSRGYWYLLAWCHLAGDVRLFRLDRILSVRLTKSLSEKREEIEDRLPEVIGEYRPCRKSYRVKLKFKGREGRRIVEEWPVASVRENRDGTLSVSLRTRSLSWVSNYLLKFGDRVEIEAPQELRELVSRKAEMLLDAYG